ncbi:Hypothetical protein NTJ_08272 [Nesidiocoris tenuis]|uniref:Uncharacterized protein n=1 Tax=Nesidiocoris tenuis TaxID=355587 RepID=A0ABN7ATU5_9HEMI|nr:Hypothetical protein NTJ_08272 [Nesidiocoris tenuis]
MDEGGVKGSPKAETLPSVILHPPELEGKSPEVIFDVNDLDYEDVLPLGFKHVHFPPDSSLVKVVFLPPLPKKEHFVKKIAKKICCTSP